jgi:translation initiation factor 3 subunit B
VQARLDFSSRLISKALEMAIPTRDDANEGIDYSDIEAKYQVEFQDGFDNILVVDGVPVIDNSKLEKLLARIVKEFTRRGAAIKSDDISMPWNDATGKSKGYAFIEFRSVDEANIALAAMHGYPFDAKHKLSVHRFTDIEKFANMDPGFVEEEPEEFKPREHLRAWLADPQGRDQFVTNRADEVIINWHGKPSQSGLAYKKPDGSPPWTEMYVSWSPQGTYLATLHQQGVRLWGGPSFQPLQRFRHPFVLLVDFSPNERYLVTWSHEPIVVRDSDPRGPEHFTSEDEGNQIAVWDIESGALLRTFPVTEDDVEDRGTAKRELQWPALKWSPDDKFVGRVTRGQQISVYELPSMGLHGKKSIKVEGVVDFDWCPRGDVDREDAEKTAAGVKGARKPRENMLAYWTPEVANQPARVTLMNFPTRAVLRQKNLFNVNQCTLHWQNQGDFLCVKVDLHTKTKKTVFCNLEIFLVREKDYPVEVVELKDTVLEFSWEPRGERFAIISSSDPNIGNPAPGITLKTEVSFYQLDRTKGDFRLLRALPPGTSNTLRWSPQGRFIVLATVGSPTKSELQFWDLDFNVDLVRKEATKEEWGSGIQHVGTGDHYGVTDLEWDPSGRNLATSASAWKHRLENGYTIWDFRGQEVQKHIQDHFKQFLWRPRPPTLLSKDQQRQVRKNLREFTRQFDEEDAMEDSNVSAELIAQRKRLVDEWNAWRARCKEQVAAARGGAGKPADKKAKEAALEEIEVWIEEVIEQIEEEVVE